MAPGVPDGFFTNPLDRRDPVTNDTYPWGWDYQFFGLLRHVRYMGDPLRDDPVPKGLPYQVRASGRNGLILGIRAELYAGREDQRAEKAEQRAAAEESRSKEDREKAYANLVDFYRMGSEVIVVNI
ncbi:hypothetical protein [Streptomyces sp. NPDC093598]|uniref:hypothetical protein n=1 Tax=Streptomyces sp. NPDC093598 TaxID=3366046 RepID=UPI00380E6C95